MTQTVLESVLARLDQDGEGAIQCLFEFLRIPSISTDPTHGADCRLAAEWCAVQLRDIGFDARVCPTAGQPMVVAHCGEKQNAPHILFYGHYDVQPPDPLQAWDSPPFEPRIATTDSGKEVIVARGASDDKGQVMTFIEACRAWREVTGDLPLRVTVLIEGEEESGSPSLAPFLKEHGDEIKADLALICDTEMWDAETPAITASLRGILLEEVIITAADRDLHSGLFGGVACNPIHVLANVIAQIRDETGKIAIPGFYDDVVDADPERLVQWEELGVEAEDMLGKVGLNDSAGEQNYAVLEQLWSRPSCDVNGVIGGYTGTGSKTVIPATASAKFSFRLVAEQDPRLLSYQFRHFVRQLLPPDCSCEFIRHGAETAISFANDSTEMVMARKALSDEFGKPALVVGSGASIPIVTSFKQKFGMNSLLVGFALESDYIHSPNENYQMTSFRHGARAWARILAELASDGSQQDETADGS